MTNVMEQLTKLRRLVEATREQERDRIAAALEERADDFEWPTCNIIDNLAEEIRTGEIHEEIDDG